MAHETFIEMILNFSTSSHKNSNFTLPKIIKLFRLVLYTSETIEATPKEFQELQYLLAINNLSFHELKERLIPNCENTILRCKWKGSYERCNNMFQKVPTSYGTCCSFNSLLLTENTNKRTDFEANDDVEYTTSCGPETGLTVLLNPDLEDYHLASRKVAGMQVYVQDAYDFTDSNALQSLITPKSVNYIGIKPQQTRATDYITSLDLRSRRCYLPKERKLFHFHSYSQANCLVECRSSMLYRKCNCTLNNWPTNGNWSICGLEHRECVLKNKGKKTFSISAFLYSKDSLIFRSVYFSTAISKCRLSQ